MRDEIDQPHAAHPKPQAPTSKFQAAHLNTSHHTTYRYNLSVPHNGILTKILATVGPACGSADMLVRLIEEGARVFRINFSHGGFDDFERALANIRKASKRTEVPIGVLGDLSGPKIRVQ